MPFSFIHEHFVVKKKKEKEEKSLLSLLELVGGVKRKCTYLMSQVTR